MKRNRLFLLIILTVFCVGITISAVNAASTTVKLKNEKFSTKKLKYGDSISSVYHTSYWGLCEGKRHIHMELNGYSDRVANHHRFVKVKIYYKYKGKVKTRKYKADKWGYSIDENIPKGYRPYKAKVWYKQI